MLRMAQARRRVDSHRQREQGCAPERHLSRESLVPPRSLAGIGLTLLSVLAACADDRKPVDETATIEPIGWGCLDRIGELVNDPLHPAPPPYCRIGVLSGLQRVGRALPVTAVLDRGSECWPTPQGFMIDLAPGVAARFHAAFTANPSFVPMADSPACPPQGDTGPIPALPGGAQTAIEFTTTNHASVADAAGNTLILPAQVEARLLDAVTGRPIWNDRCDVDISELRGAASLPDESNLRQVLSDEALRCAQGFAAALGAPAPPM